MRSAVLSQFGLGVGNENHEAQLKRRRSERLVRGKFKR